VITVSVTNRPPVANPDSYSVSENSVTNVLTPLVNDVVVTPGGSLTIIGVVPTNGTAVIVGGTNVLFTPSTNFTGTATIGYTIIDNVGGTNSSVITVSVTNRPPVANPDSYSVSENSVTNVLTAIGERCCGDARGQPDDHRCCADERDCGDSGWDERAVHAERRTSPGQRRLATRSLTM
jgi:hypothetical protein